MSGILSELAPMLFIAILVFVKVSEKSNKKQKAQAKREPNANMQKETAKPGKAAKPAKAAKPMKPGMMPKASPPAPKVELQEAPQPTSLQGSLGDVFDEGESQEEHGEHLQRYAAEETPRVQSRAQLRTQKLRSAVIWSEVLSKPVSLREE